MNGDWTQTWTIIGFIGGLVSILTGTIIYLFGKTDSQIIKLTNRLDSHANRIDLLYQMFVDLLKGKSHKQEEK